MEAWYDGLRLRVEVTDKGLEVYSPDGVLSIYPALSNQVLVRVKSVC